MTRQELIYELIKYELLWLMHNGTYRDAEDLAELLTEQKYHNYPNQTLINTYNLRIAEEGKELDDIQEVTKDVNT